MFEIEERYYFAYGSNMNLDQMGFRCPDAVVVDNVPAGILRKKSGKRRGNDPARRGQPCGRGDVEDYPTL